VSYTPGWYPDPSGQPGAVRYWDGQRWTEYRQGPDPSGAPRPAGPPGAGSGAGPQPWAGAGGGAQPNYGAPPPPRSRSGCARAAIVVVGLIVVLIVILGIVANESQPHKQKGPVPVVQVPIGQTVEVPPAQRYVGTAAITVYSLVVPYPVPQEVATPGTVGALADAQVCAGNGHANLSAGTVFVALPFVVILADGRQDQIEYNNFPNVSELQDKLRDLGPHQCIRGYLEFSVEAPSTVVGVGYGGTQTLNDEWLLPKPVQLGPVAATTTTQP
jgi:hypothetical protein